MVFWRRKYVFSFEVFIFVLSTNVSDDDDDEAINNSNKKTKKNVKEDRSVALVTDTEKLKIYQQTGKARNKTGEARTITSDERKEFQAYIRTYTTK